MKIKKSWVVFIGIVALICLLIFLRPPAPVGVPSTTEIGQPIGDVLSGATDIKRFSDMSKNAIAASANATTTPNIRVRPTRTPVPPPYPRITINFSSQAVSSIRNNNAGNGSFIIVTVEIQNYGYKYFVANPMKFRGLLGNSYLAPSINVSTGNMLNAVLPNNSRAQGDIVFLVSGRGRGVGGIQYISGGYNILYHRGLYAPASASATECADC